MPLEFPLVYSNSSSLADGSLVLHCHDQNGQGISLLLDRAVGSETYNCLLLNHSELLSREDELAWLEVLRLMLDETPFQYATEVELIKQFIAVINGR